MAAVNLSELFNQKIFRIPDYQRGYAWGEKQLTELWDDLDEIMEVEGDCKKHYTGSLYLEERQPAEDERWVSGTKFLHVVDGQQRLTTITILMFELLRVSDDGYCGETKEDLLKTFIVKPNASGNSKVYRFSYNSTSENYDYLLHAIFEDNQHVLRDSYLNLYSKNLQEAKTFFRIKIADLEPLQREVLYKKLTTCLQFDIRLIEKDLDVQAVFETMNNRGKPLSTLEKLKNRLIYLAVKLPIDEVDKKSLRKKINDAWGKIYSTLARNPDRILDEDFFLSAHLSLYRTPTDYVFSEDAAEEKLFQMFCNKAEKNALSENGTAFEPRVDYEKINDYVLKLSALAPVWYLVHNSGKKLVKRIIVLNSTKECKIFLCTILRFANEATVTEILVKLERLLFRNRVPRIGLMDERVFANWARDIYSEEDTSEGITTKINEFLATPVNMQALIQGFNALFYYERGPKGFHRWGSLKYFLFDYEDYLKQKAREVHDKVTIDEFEQTTIEHVIPQQFWDNWKREVDAFTNGLDNNEQVEQACKVLIHTLGNLTILRNGKNASLGNRRWLEKRERFSTGSYNEIAISRHAEWTTLQVAERGVEMLRFLETKVSGLVFSAEDLNRVLYMDKYIWDRMPALPPGEQDVPVA